MVLDLNESIGNFKSVVFENKIKNRIKFKLNFKENQINNKINNKITLTESIVKIINILPKLDNDKINSKDVDFNYYLIDLIKKRRENKVKSIEFFVKITKSERVVIDEFEINYFNSFKSKIKMDRNSYYIFFNGEKVNEPNLVKPNKFLFDINESKVTRKLSKSNLENIAMFEYSIMDIKEQ